MSIQLQNFVSLTTTGTSGASTLTNGVLNVPNYATGGGGTWVDYSATSTIVGWSSFTTKVIKYSVNGKQIFFIVEFDGTSNSTSATFTMPNNTINSILTYGWSKNNGVSNPQSLIYTAANSNIITCYNGNSSTWTASGSKGFQCQFFIITS